MFRNLNSSNHGKMRVMIDWVGCFPVLSFRGHQIWRREAMNINFWHIGYFRYVMTTIVKYRIKALSYHVIFMHAIRFFHLYFESMHSHHA